MNILEILQSPIPKIELSSGYPRSHPFLDWIFPDVNQLLGYMASWKPPYENSGNRLIYGDIYPSLPNINQIDT